MSTIPTHHDVNPFVQLLKRDATLVLAGVLEPLEPGVNNMYLAMQRRGVHGTMIGGIAETQEVLDFCADNGITSQVEVIPIDRINEAYERMNRKEVRYRQVIDMSSLQAPSP